MPRTSAACASEDQRNNENLLAKGSYFLSPQSAGSHDLAFGYDTFNDIRFAESTTSRAATSALGADDYFFDATTTSTR